MKNEILRAVLIDDEDNCLKMLQWELNNRCPEVEILAMCDSGKEGLKAIKKHQPDVVFLDIEMPYMNGFEMLELTADINFEVIFTTAYDQYAIKAFKISAVDYLLKPIDEDNLTKAVERVKEKLKQNFSPYQINYIKQQVENVKHQKVKNIALPTLEGLIFVALEHIIYCQSDGGYARVYLMDGRNIFISRTLREMEEILEGFQFKRVHNSFIINLDHIKKYIKADGGYLIMSNDNEVKVSRSKKDELLKLF